MSNEINLGTCTPEQRLKWWTDQAAKNLVGKTISEVRYLNKDELEGLGWDSSALVIFFTDGTYVFPSSDDEGNSPGALFTNFEGLETIPVI